MNEFPPDTPETSFRAPEGMTTLAEQEDNLGILGRLLRIADAYRISGALHQAMELYFQLLREFAVSPEARKAQQHLLDIAEHHERWGEPRLARSIYEQLL
ncbi:MAG: hypothetical protein AAB037_07190 [Chloroflexota bacterium]